MQGILHFYKKVHISRNWQVYSKQQKKKHKKTFTFEECFSIVEMDRGVG